MKTLHLVMALALVNSVFLSGGIFLASKRVESRSKVAITPTKASPSLTTIISQTPKPTPQAQETPEVTPTVLVVEPLPPATTPSDRCLIQVDGVTYDVTDFRLIHGGGDIFVCGTNMSAIFHDRHPVSYLAKMERYRI